MMKSPSKYEMAVWLRFITASSPISINQHPVHNRNSPLRTLRHQFLDRDPQSRIITPTLLQEVKPRILPLIRRNFKRKTPELYYSGDISE
ncbi:MAG: hypothetical protein V7K72_26875 [Nostoc sp.]|uniref:hypothetical protein n=1 Tax=Nostoc sp. TaxID=1180 RepID=UPI002FF5803F